MLFAQRLNVIPIENSLLAHITLIHVAIKVAVKVIAHPDRERKIKTLLGRRRILLWQQVVKSILEYQLALPRTQLVAKWRAQSVLDHTVIKIRHAHFQTHSHTHLVGVLEHVVREKGLHIDSQRTIARLLAVTLLQ